MSDLDFRTATLDDVAVLHALIERAYRGDSAKAGWTHEADLLFDDRTSAGELSALIADPRRAVLLALRDSAVVGCVQVAHAADDLAYLGMLTVEPTLQAGGLGRGLLAAAEDEARRRFHARRIEMTVIRSRAELIAWYARRGYALTGEERPFPVSPPRPELAFVVLEKRLH